MGGNTYVKMFHKIRLTTCAIDFQNKRYITMRKKEIIEHKRYEEIKKLFRQQQTGKFDTGAKRNETFCF